MHAVFDPLVIASGLFVGFVVGLTGMGGGALMTPILVLLFHVEPLAAVSSDIVAAMVMKPIGGAVHWRRGTVQRGLVAWLMLGSIPSAFFGVLLLRRMDAGIALQGHIKLALGIALLVVVNGLVVRPLLISRRQAPHSFELKRIPTLLIGIVGGLVVGLTSVGSGSLIIVALLLLYPRMELSELVGTDLVQAVPLVASAAIGHLLFGNFKLGLTVSILIGSIPGVFVGARFSSRAPDYVIRPSLAIVLLLSGLKLVGASNLILAVVTPISVAVGLSYALSAARHARKERLTRAVLPAHANGTPVPVPLAAVSGAHRAEQSSRH
ncbi:MAG TPA: sulfite exporter TauE/SafE family protein [Polyangia bacterium]|nr:sulfite exporter TauE/SafE family protein [Polyangia bacterium]